MAGRHPPDGPGPADGCVDDGPSPGSDVFRGYVAAIEHDTPPLVNAVAPPDLLEENADEDEAEGLTRAEYLHEIARWCRNFTQDPDTNACLKDAGWTSEDEGAFLLAFRNLVDAWSTYHRVFGFLADASWGGEPTPGQVLMDLQMPRRNFITALDKYLGQLLVVRHYLPPQEGISSPA